MSFIATCVDAIGTIFWDRPPVTDFKVVQIRPIGWTHIILNYFGSTAGIKVYYNGTEVASDTHMYTSSYSSQPADGRIVVGRMSTNRDQVPNRDILYTSMQMDELSYFNKTLSTTEITTMYNAV